MAKFGKERFPHDYQNAVGMNASSTLHENSKELVKLLKQHNILNSESKIFELGTGPARNLHYINGEFKTNNIYYSDLFAESSKNNMSESIKNIITFYEGDSQDIIDDNIIKDLAEELKHRDEGIFNLKDEELGSDKVIMILKQYIKVQELV